MHGEVVGEARNRFRRNCLTEQAQPVVQLAAEHGRDEAAADVLATPGGREQQQRLRVIAQMRGNGSAQRVTDDVKPLRGKRRPHGVRDGCKRVRT